MMLFKKSLLNRTMWNMANRKQVDTM